MEELLTFIEYLRTENKRISEDRLMIFGFDRLIEQNEKHILRLEKRIEEIEEERCQEERRQLVEEMR